MLINQIYEKATAISAASFALFLISSIFDDELSPPVSSLTRFNINGVILAPDIPCNIDS